MDGGGGGIGGRDGGGAVWTEGEEIGRGGGAGRERDWLKVKPKWGGGVGGEGKWIE